jgi:predicted metal-dependent TIM-barrel fold hydrolase
MVGTAADVPGEIRYLTYGEQQTMRRALQASSRLIAIGAEAPGVVLHLTDEQRDVMRQELYQLAQKLDAQARVATPRSTRQRSLIKRSALIRSVAEQLA